ncbi:hypothetical protein LCGC14_1540190 [marine sediment metagenome]|uniref:Uncharacterized protein n=1 Tax=marine sediment metagenome TaxID=412755 RepID=A0A0F9JE83_9ZZZZ
MRQYFLVARSLSNQLEDRVGILNKRFQQGEEVKLRDMEELNALFAAGVGVTREALELQKKKG